MAIRKKKILVITGVIALAMKSLAAKVREALGQQD